jgi:hypothetical protein
MTDLDQALVDIRELRRQVASTSEFRGYGPWTLWGTALVAILAGIAQSLWVPHPTRHPIHYFVVWAAAAIVSISLIGFNALTRSHREHSSLAAEMIRMAAEQFIPAFGTGILLTLIFLWRRPENAWLLPALWQIVYGLGIFASCRFLPKSMRAAGVWYVLMGVLSVWLGEYRALRPTVMAASFAIGQAIIGLVLYFHNSELPDEF